MILYVVGTPIGNIKDITYRAVETLKECDAILCEDTRCSLKILNYFEIKKKLISYHKFNEFKLLEKIIDDIKNGVKYALISDAGMPCISDPGKILINRCIKEGIKIEVLPGACALINAKILSGFENDIFTFIGFLPKHNKDLKQAMDMIKSVESVFILYEAPHRLISTLDVLKDNLGGDSIIYIGRELTKMFEENFRGSIDECINYFSKSKIKGEFVICIDNKLKTQVISDEDILNEFEINKMDGLTNKDNIKKICDKYGVKKNYVYNLILKETHLT